MLKGILAIAGQPGLYKLISQSKNNVIVESLDNGKRMPVYSATKVSALEDIAMYTYNTEVPLAEVFSNIAQKENCKACPLGKTASNDEFKAYFETVLPDYDRERVYISDIKKVFTWYNLLQEKGLAQVIEKETAEAVK
jgi:hypothetical protein